MRGDKDREFLVTDACGKRVFPCGCRPENPAQRWADTVTLSTSNLFVAVCGIGQGKPHEDGRDTVGLIALYHLDFPVNREKSLSLLYSRRSGDAMLH